MHENDVVVMEHDADDNEDALVTGVGMFGGGGSGAIKSVASTVTVKKFFGFEMLCCKCSLLLVLVGGVGVFGVDGLELGKLSAWSLTESKFFNFL